MSLTVEKQISEERKEELGIASWSTWYGCGAVIECKGSREGLELLC